MSASTGASLPDPENSRSMSRVKSIRVGNTSQFIDISDLPVEIRGVFETYDTDGDGMITTTELADAALAQKTLKAQNSLFRRGLIFTSGVAVAMVAVMGGMTYGIIDASKDTVVDGRALLTKNAEPVSVNTNEVSLPLGALGWMPNEIVAKITGITMGTDTTYHRTKKSIDVEPNKSFLLTTLDGDTIRFDSEEADAIHITLADGTTWSNPSDCSQCSAFNVVADQDIMSLLDEYFDSLEEAKGQRKLGLGPNPHRELSRCR